MTNSLFFGSGVLVATPAGANQTPIEFGVLQDCSVDFSFTPKPLLGQFQMPVAVARGAGKISGSAKFADIRGAVFNQLFFPSANVTSTTGQLLWAYQEAGSIGTSPYTYTTVNSATFNADEGVRFASNGVPLTRVASAPAAGQYSLSAGVYTFNTADNGKAILVTYTYTQTVVGSRQVIGNPLMGVTTTFQIDLYQTNPNVSGQQWSLRLYSCLASKLTFATKLEDWNIPQFDFEAFANGANQIGEFNPANL